MTATQKPYTRLTRAAAGLASYSSLWLGADHMLIVTSTGYSENYARIMLRDIKALFVTRTERRLFWGLAWGVLTAAAGLRVLFVLLARQRPVASVIFLAIGAIGLTISHLLGAGCRVHMITGVQTAILPSLVRERKTQRVLARIQPLIEAAQAELVAPAAAPLPEPAASPSAAAAEPTPNAGAPAEHATPVPPSSASAPST